MVVPVRSAVAVLYSMLVHEGMQLFLRQFFVFVLLVHSVLPQSIITLWNYSIFRFFRQAPGADEKTGKIYAKIYPPTRLATSGFYHYT